MKRPIALGDRNVFARLHGSGKNAGNGQTAQVVAVIEIRDQDLQWPIFVPLRRRNRIDDGLKQQPQVLARRSLMHGSRSRLGVRIQDREVELLFLGVEIDKKVVNLVQNFLRTGIGTVDFINDENRLQVRFESFAEYV